MQQSSKDRTLSSPAPALPEVPGYRVLNKIGSGGMGVVYRATDVQGNFVALKMLRTEIAFDAHARERLAREVKNLARVKSVGVAQVVDAELELDTAFLVTEFIVGPNLEQSVREHGPLHPRVVAELGLCLGDVLKDIHAADLIHRDVKPSNVMLRGAKEVALRRWDVADHEIYPVLIDFGIAHAADESRMTSTGLVMGTAAYMDPEISLGRSITQQTDWWGWAATLVYAATGRQPFGKGTADIIWSRAGRGDVDVEGVHPVLAQFLKMALEPNPARRKSPNTLLQNLRELDLSDAAAKSGRAQTPQPQVTGLDKLTGNAADRPIMAAYLEQTDPSRPVVAPLSATEPATTVIDADSHEVPTAVEKVPATEVLGALDAQATTVIAAPKQGAAQGAETSSQTATAALPLTRTNTAQIPIAGKSAATTDDSAPKTGSVNTFADESKMLSGPSNVHVQTEKEIPKRRSLIFTVGAALVAAMTVFPLYGFAAFLLLLVVAHLVASASFQLESRRSASGPRKSDGWMVALASPWHIVKAVALAVLFAIPGVVVGGIIAGVTAIILDGGMPTGSDWRSTALVTGIFGLVLVVYSYTGLGGRLLRRGVRVLAASLVPKGAMQPYLIIVLIFGMGALAITLINQELQANLVPLRGVSLSSYISQARESLRSILPF